MLFRASLIFIYFGNLTIMKYCSLLLFFLITPVIIFSQTKTEPGYIITLKGDTIKGELENRSYYKIRKVKLNTQGVERTYHSKMLREIYAGENKYVKQGPQKGPRFLKEELNGHLKLYSFKKRYIISRFIGDSDNAKQGIKIHCDDYPNLKDTLETLNRKNIKGFVSNYNSWKMENPQSKSYYEKYMHHKKIITPQFSLLIPGVAAEIKINNMFSYRTGINVGIYLRYKTMLIPYLNNQLRYYYDYKKRVKENKRTLKYTGNYIAAVNYSSLNFSSNTLGLAWGTQHHGKRIYNFISYGLGYNLTYNRFHFLLDYGFGFSF